MIRTPFDSDRPVLTRSGPYLISPPVGCRLSGIVNYPWLEAMQASWKLRPGPPPLDDLEKHPAPARIESRNDGSVACEVGFEATDGASSEAEYLASEGDNVNTTAKVSMMEAKQPRIRGLSPPPRSARPFVLINIAPKPTNIWVIITPPYSREPAPFPFPPSSMEPEGDAPARAGPGSIPAPFGPLSTAPLVMAHPHLPPPPLDYYCTRPLESRFGSGRPQPAMGFRQACAIEYDESEKAVEKPSTRRLSTKSRKASKNDEDRKAMPQIVIPP
ncbi:hypothetical protein N657DRAFT_395592 [Parathielavia appendiculata]|uniref:Uncharacterized protein n=1 Tax=Parathielavia appendiculata TaxID=2587402 RepID=A0AAN6Z4D1_9PEZI|nr:hypothetical protein N657DRAFT_395592 [Parathielavia appendiculata]